MKKKVIALLLSILLAAGSIGTPSVLAAETTAEKAADVQEEGMEEQDGTSDEAEISDDDLAVEDNSEDETTQVQQEESADSEEVQIVPVQTEDASADVDETVDAVKTDDASLKSGEAAVIDEEIETVVENEALNAGSIVDSGTCEDNLTWTLDSEGSLTISGEGIMRGYPWKASHSSDIKSVIIENGITTISDSAFEECSELENVTIPSSVTYIGAYAFYKCSNLISINLPIGLETIRPAAFARCSSLTSIEIPSSVTQLFYWTFTGCSSLKSIEIPYGITSIGEEMFSGCKSLETVTLPSTIQYIVDSGFESCDSLKDVYFNGFKEEWDAIQISSYQNDALLNATIHFLCNHSWNTEYTVDKEATCTEEGSESIHCSLCDEIDETTVRSIPKKDHNYGEWEIVKEAKCTEAGSRKKVCADCGDEVTEEIPAKGHTWNEEYTVDKEPTCAEEGTESIHCSVCEAVKEGSARTIEKLAHTYGEWEIVKEAKCTEAGSRKKVCADCGDEVTEEIPAKGHTWNTEFTIDKEPTDKEEGSKSIHCSVCNAVKEGSEVIIPMLAKDLSGLTITGIANKTYIGKAVTQALVIKDGSKTLVLDTDYTVSYKNNTNTGTATVDIKGKGSYTGTVTKTFMILPGKTTRGDMFNLANNVKVTWTAVPGAKYYKVYRSGVKDPVIVTTGLVGWDKEPGLVNGQKYTYKIVASLTGKGDSSGDSTLSYSKVMYRLKTVVIRSVNNTAPGKVTVRYDKTTSGDSYVLQYCERQDMVGAKTKVVLGANNTSYVIGGLKKGKTYYISIRVRKKVNGIDYYTTFGVPKKVTVTK